MTERAAIILLFTALSVVLVAAVLVLRVLNTSNDAIVLVYLAVLSIGGLSCGQIVVHYTDKPPSKRD